MVSTEEWQTVLREKGDIEHISKERVRKSIIVGVPPSLRGDIWCLLCKCKEEASIHSPDLYKKLLDIGNEAEEYKISKDIKRTLPELQMFREDYRTGKNKLFNVLKAYATYDNELGYA